MPRRVRDTAELPSLEKRNHMPDTSGISQAAPEFGSPTLAHHPQPLPDGAAGSAVAVFVDAALSCRTSGFDADGVALDHGRAGVAAMDRSGVDVTGFPAGGGGLRGRQVLQPS